MPTFSALRLGVEPNHMSWFSKFRGGGFIGAFSEALDLANLHPMPTLLEGSGPSKSKPLFRLTFGVLLEGLVPTKSGNATFAPTRYDRQKQKSIFLLLTVYFWPYSRLRYWGGLLTYGKLYNYRRLIPYHKQIILWSGKIPSSLW